MKNKKKETNKIMLASEMNEESKTKYDRARRRRP